METSGDVTLIHCHRVNYIVLKASWKGLAESSYSKDCQLLVKVIQGVLVCIMPGTLAADRRKLLTLSLSVLIN